MDLSGIPSLRNERLAVPLRFGAYRVVAQDGTPRVDIYVPGHAPTQGQRVVLEYLPEGNQKPQEVMLTWQGHQWALPKDKLIPNHQAIAYRLYEDNGQERKLIPEHTYIKTIHNQPYAYIPANTPADLCSTGVVLNQFRDSLLSLERLAEAHQLREETGDTLRYKRTHFNRLGGLAQPHPFLQQVYKTYGITGDEERPLLGGDKLSAHGYWTTSLMQPSAALPSQQAFDNMILDKLKHDVRMWWDLAAVNEGLNGIHYLANLYHKEQSPFLHWFDYGPLNAFPDQKLKLGVLPAKADPQTRHEIVNDAAWDIRFLNASLEPVTHADQGGPFYVELFDPRLEQPDGRPKAAEASQKQVSLLAHSQASVQKYRFPISKAEYLEKQKALAEAARISNAAVREKILKDLKRNWRHFELTLRSLDNSGYCWDGQRDVKKINIHHPDITQYVREACQYWTDKVDRRYTLHLAKSLSKVSPKAHQPAKNWYQAIDQLTQKHPGDPSGIIPPLRGGEANPVTVDSLAKALAKDAKQYASRHPSAAQCVIQELKSNFNPAILPGPPMMQVLLHTPKLNALLKEGEVKPWFLLFSTVMIEPLGLLINVLFPGSKLGQRFRNWAQQWSWARQKPFYQQLADKLSQSLSPDVQKQLQHPALAHLVYEDIGRSIFLSLMSGQYISPLSKGPEIGDKAMAKVYAKHIPAFITQAPPEVAAKLLCRFLVDQLKQFNTAQLNAPIRKMLMGVTPEAVSVARHVLHQRRFGLHWRIDALKDMGDMDGVRAEPNAQKRLKRMETVEIPKIKQIMGTIAEGIRSVFPNSIIKAEITRLEYMAGLPTQPNFEKAAELQAALMEGNTINSMPNYPYWFMTGYKAVRCSQPDGEGEAQLTPAAFLEKKLLPMMASLPLDKVMAYQNMGTNPDKATAVGYLTLHPYMARYDYFEWFGLNNKTQPTDEDKGIFHLVLQELQHKPQVAFLKHGIPDSALEKLKSLASQSHVLAFLQSHKQYGTLVMPYLKENPGVKAEIPIPMPTDVKKAYIDALFEVIQPKDLGLSAEQHQKLHNALRLLMAEPSETKALRGKLANALNQVVNNPPPELVNALGGSRTIAGLALHDLVPDMQLACWKLIQDLPETDWRWLGHQQMDYVIDWTVDKLLASPNSPNWSWLKYNKNACQAFKQAWYNETVKEALEQHKRMTALQIAIPGDPTLYIPDLLGQAGREGLQNMYLGNREAIRYDWLETNPLIKAYFEELGAIVRQRQSYHVLNNGTVVFPLDPRDPKQKALLDKTSVLPLIRDNGTDQAICLINFGQPQPDWASFMDSHRTPLYPELHSTQPLVRNYKLDLSYLRIPVGTVYKSVDPETREDLYYAVNPQGLLVRLKGKPDGDKLDYTDDGMDIRIARTLIRIHPKAATTPA